MGINEEERGEKLQDRKEEEGEEGKQCEKGTEAKKSNGELVKEEELKEK